MAQAFLAFGANLGDRLASLRGARELLTQTAGIDITRASAVYETTAVGGPPGQGDYLNAVAVCETVLSARELLRRALEIEDLFGRQRQERWGARTLDIDLLFYGEAVIAEPDLCLPHPHLHRRAFVLVPLAEVAPDLRHPLLALTVRQFLAALADTGGVRRLGAEW
jgi:2-amino-4-hydroxy-6-hydroxymethyldihydropteridine diphosphokinase